MKSKSKKNKKIKSKVKEKEKERKDFVDRAWEAQRVIEDRGGKIGKGKYGRVLKMARKPEPDEYSKTCKITAIGIIIIGIIGFSIYLIVAHVAPWISKLLGI
jgi:protein transport protein SEC61 subunit gamma-like protein